MLESRLDNALKRAMDFAGAAVGVTTLAVPLALVAAAIKVDSKGPVFYRGVRVGLNGKLFRVFKFRTMGLHDGSGPSTTSEDDRRITRVGRMIRRYKIDELPQLINVLLGQMSLVGPRPEVQWCVALYTNEEREILRVRPGITDWSSIKFHNEGEIVRASGYESADQAYLEIIRPEKLRLQLKYVRERSVKVDMEIIWETLATLWSTRARPNEPIRAKGTHHRE